MAKSPGPSMLVIEELLERGDPSFVGELRAFDDAARLAPFAAKWYADRRPIARKFLLDYLNQPLNALRHEPLVKRLFKLAEAAGDDEVMAGFLVLFDRSVRRRRRRRYHNEYQTVNSRDAAQALIRKWTEEGAESTNLWEWSGQISVTARWPIERIRVPAGTVMPRGASGFARSLRIGQKVPILDRRARAEAGGRVPFALKNLPDVLRRYLEDCRLFTVHTRRYLCRRAWRYFRRLGKEHSERYVRAIVGALKRYQDDDVADGLALLDNWGLVHALFHHSPALVAKNNGWTLVKGSKLAELKPAPIFEDLWKNAPRSLLELLRDGLSRTVRRWALHFLRQGGALANLPSEELLTLLGHQDAEVAAVAAEALRQARDLHLISLERWLALLDQANAAALDSICAMMAKHLQPAQVTLAQAVALTSRRETPIARLGLSWLRVRAPATAEDCELLLKLTDAQAKSLREEIVRWARQVLSASTFFQSAWVLEFLDCRHADVHAVGWHWLEEEPRARDDVEIWRRLFESPYDDIRLKLVAELERRVAGRSAVLIKSVALDGDMIRLLWATVLLNIHRGNRSKPLVVGQIVEHLRHHAGDAASLLPILSVALRSIRGPEWRAGLAGVVKLVEQNPSLDRLVRETFPELKLAV